jgi:hypothetical protein
VTLVWIVFLTERLKAFKTEPYQAPVGIENRAVGEPEPIPYIDPYKQGDNYVTDDAIYNPTGGRNVFEEAKAPAEDIQASINYLGKLTKNEHTADSRYRRNQAKNG